MAPHDPDDAEGIPPDLEDEQERQQRRFEMGIED